MLTQWEMEILNELNQLLKPFTVAQKERIKKKLMNINF